MKFIGCIAPTQRLRACVRTSTGTDTGANTGAKSTENIYVKFMGASQLNLSVSP